MVVFALNPLIRHQVFVIDIVKSRSKLRLFVCLN
jgi:hypothetical protein